MWSPRLFEPRYASAVLELGRQGLSPAQMAAELSVSLADFEAWTRCEPSFAVALADAETLAHAWWDALPRAAMTSGASFRAAAWAKAMAQRFRTAPPRRPPRDAARPDAKVEAVFDIPDNGRERRPPHGGRD